MTMVTLKYDQDHNRCWKNIAPLVTMQQPFHSFHIPVMGLAFTVDTPIKVARFGISSVISIIEDKLIEMMRRHYSGWVDKPYTPITDKDHDYRARRITDYLNLVNEIVGRQMETLRNSAFDKGSELAKYFQMLPSGNPLRQLFVRMEQSSDTAEKISLQQVLRDNITAGAIDVNIMTKVDKNNFDKEGNAIPDTSDAVAALRGYINSDLKSSSIIFSAGMNPRLFNYLEKVTAFRPLGFGVFDKKVVIKVSDYRSALIQGKYLAKKGIWVSEFRIESGLNCGGHAFATDGALLGPILEEFKAKKEELSTALHSVYNPVALAREYPVFDNAHPIQISVQGGIGTHDEATFLSEQYGVYSTGWGTPFLLCPEATTVDNETLNLLARAVEKDVILSRSSPLGVRFNYLKGTSAERERLERIRRGRPGSPCTEKHLVSNTEFSKEPICTASHTYQKQKIAQLQSLNLEKEEYEKQYEEVVSKECLCIGLMNSAVHKYDLPPVKKLEAVTICPGPNIAYFNRIVSLHEMADHIYGRTNILPDERRPHMFIKELSLNIDYLREQVEGIRSWNEKLLKDVTSFGNELLNGIEYYRHMADAILKKGKDRFLQELDQAEENVKGLFMSCQMPAAR